jgi:hypothetical protein
VKRGAAGCQRLLALEIRSARSFREMRDREGRGGRGDTIGKMPQRCGFIVVQSVRKLSEQERTEKFSAPKAPPARRVLFCCGALHSDRS